MPSLHDFAMTLSRIVPAATIAFTAPKGTGKDTTARRLITGKGEPANEWGPWHHAYARGLYRIDKCAATLYRMVAELIGWTTDQLDGPAKEVEWTAETAPTPTLIGWSPRKLLEQLGSNFVRDKIGRDHWVQLLKARLNKHTSGITVITDCRFENEARVADLCIELRRPGKDYDERPDSEGGHESRRRLPAHLIDATFHLTPDMDYHLFAEDLILKVERKRAKVLLQVNPNTGVGIDMSFAGTPYLPGTQEALNPPLAPRQRNADDMGFPDGRESYIEER